MTWINLLLAAFNLLPAFPLDGGRILRSLLALMVGFDRATWFAVLTGRMLGVALLGVALYFRMYFLILVAVFIFHAAGQEESTEDIEDEGVSGDSRGPLPSVHVASLQRPVSVSRTLNECSGRIDSVHSAGGSTASSLSRSLRKKQHNSH